MELTDALQSAGALFGVLLTQTAIVAVAQSRAHVMHPHDLLLLANLVRSNESFRQAETFTPVCLPHFNPTAFLHAYVQYLHVVSVHFTYYSVSTSNSMLVQDRLACRHLIVNGSTVARTWSQAEKLLMPACLFVSTHMW